MKDITIELCAGTVGDAITAYESGIERVELNSALFLGGLSPTEASVRLIKEKCPGLELCVMVRPRAGGFCYSDIEFNHIVAEVNSFAREAVAGIVFGILTNDMKLDIARMKKITDIILNAGIEPVCHRAIDLVENIDGEVEKLIDIGIVRILTSGGKKSAIEGADTIARLKNKYGNYIEILAGSGINETNVVDLLNKTGVDQIHSSFRGYIKDSTSGTKYVNFDYDALHPMEVEAADPQKIKMMQNAIKKLHEDSL